MLAAGLNPAAPVLGAGELSLALQPGVLGESRLAPACCRPLAFPERAPSAWHAGGSARRSKRGAAKSAWKEEPGGLLARCLCTREGL